MTKRLLRDFVGILLVYLIYAGVTVWLYDPDSFLGDDPPMRPVWMWIASLTGMLIWYVLGEWVIRPQAGAVTWLGAWFGVMALIGLCAVIVALLEDSGYWWLHFLGGIGAYYLSSVLFSPLFAKYRIWPAKLVRNW